MDEFDLNMETPLIPDINAQAAVNLAAAKDHNPEAELAAVKESEKTGIPVGILSNLDNAEMKKPNVDSLHPATQRVLADPVNAAVLRDKVPETDDVMRVSDYANGSLAQRRKARQREIRERGYTPEELASLKAAGYTRLDNGKFRNAAGWTVTLPVMDEWYCGSEELKALDKMRKPGNAPSDAAPDNSIPDDAGAAYLMLHPDKAEALIQRKSRDIAAMKRLYTVYGDRWHQFNDAELRIAIDTAGQTAGADFSDVSPARLRRVGLGMETRWAEAVNFFGIQDLLERRTALSGKELAEVYRNPGSYDLADQMAVIEKLDEQARALRGSTGWNTAANVTLSSLRFAAELGTTANASGILAALNRESVAGFFKSIPRFLGLLGKQEIKRLPAYAVPKAAETFSELQSAITPVIENGAVLPGMTEDQTSEFANAYFNKMLDTFIENYSEGLGSLISVPVMKALSKAVPQTIKNAAFVKIAENVLHNTKTSKGAKIASMVYENSMFNGLLGEYTEEKWGDAIRAGATFVARALGTKYGDLGQETVFGSVEQEAELMGGLLLTGALLSTVRAPFVYGDIRRTAKFIDTQRAVNAAVQKVTAPSPDGNPVVERMIRNFSGRSDWGFLPAENARVLFQSDPETMESLGITEDVIAEAENTGRFVTVSMANVHTRVKPEQVNELILNMVPDPEGRLTAAEAEKLDLSAEQQEKFKAQEAEQQETLSAFNDALAQLRQLGRSDSEIRAASKILFSMANYIARSGMSAADWIRNVAFQKLKESDWREQLANDPVYAQTSLDNAITQARSSAGTSLNQIAAAFRKIKFAPGSVNLDLGGGRFDKATDFLAAQGVTNLVYDPANRDAEHNAKVFDAVRSGGVDTVTCNNVLNVIQEPGARSNVILQAAKALKPGGVAYFSVYEGDKSAQGRPTKSDSWQENRPTESYMDEIRQHFADVTRQGKVIIARNPVVDGKTSAWFNSGFTAAPRLFQISPVWTGSAANYDQPDTDFVGTGEGAQVYGWGLYGSSSRGVGEYYAEADARSKKENPILTFNGNRVEFYYLDRETYLIAEKILELRSIDAAEQFFRKDLQEEKDTVAELEKNNGGPLPESSIVYDNLRDAESILNLFLSIKPKLGLQLHPGTRNLYKQTFWPNMEENLLDWDEDIPQEQADLILDGLANSSGETWKRVVRFINSERDADNDWLVDEDTGEVYKDENYADDVARDYIERYTDFNWASGQYVYRQLCGILGSAKAASEFLYRAGIHGITYIGETSGERNYIAFSGKDIRVDQHIMFQGGARVSQTETPEFQEWFGDSEAVDADGKPLMVYRRDNEDVETYDLSKAQQHDAGWLGKGIYFYGDRGEAERSYGYGKTLRGFYIRAENPYFISQEEYKELVDADDPQKSAEFTERLKAEGYDSVYWNGDLRQEWMVFEPDQVKRADNFTPITMFQAKADGRSLLHNGLNQEMLTEPVPETVIDFPRIDIRDAEVVRNALARYIGMTVTIKSDGRIARFTQRNNRSALKRNSGNRIAAESLDKVIAAAYPVGWNVGDTKEKHAKILGQYIYAAAFSVTDQAGEKVPYIARIVLDGFGNENEGVFKDIAIKKAEGGTYVRSDLIRDPYRRTPSGITIHELIEKVKADYKKTHEKYFLEDIPAIVRQRDLLYERAVAENPDYARGMLRRAAKRRSYNLPGEQGQFRDGHAAPGDMGIDFNSITPEEYAEEGGDVNLVRIVEGFSPQPDDYFDNARGYMYDDPAGLEAQRNLKRAMQEISNGNPNAEITVYRAVPNGVEVSRLQNGDWVSPSRKYVVNHGESRFGEGQYRIVEEKIPAAYLWWDGNDIREWGYDNGKEEATTNAPGNRKSLDITYDDAGNLIPLSERFNLDNPDPRYQSQSEIHRGATTFNGEWNAMITLFEGAADASTLVHEIGHYTFETMRKLVERGLADERMTEDWNKLLKFIGAAPGAELTVEQSEKLARAFEAYCLEGRAPSVELEGAFATLRYLLMQVYKSVRALGVKLNDEVRAVFDGMLATDDAADSASIINEAAREINAELLGLSQSEIKTYRELIEKANRQTVQELTARKDAELRELRPQWRKEAADRMAANPVYKAWNEALSEPLDFTDVFNLTDENTALLLRSRGLVSSPGRKTEAKIDEKTGDLVKPAGYYSSKPGAHPAEAAMKAGYESAETMLRDLASALTPHDFVGSYVAEQEAAFHARFKTSEAALTAQASIDALDKLSELLAVKGGMAGYRMRREMFKRRALDEINSMNVSDVVSDSAIIGACRRQAKELTAAANESDFKTAFEISQKLRFNLEVLRHKAAARKVVSQTERLLSRARHAKRGIIYGDHQDALLDLSVRFGFTRSEKPYEHTVAEVIRDYNEQAEEGGYAPLEVPDWLLHGNIRYGNLPFGEFTMLSELAQFLDGEGRSLVKGRRAAFNAAVTESIEGCVGQLEKQKHRYTRDSIFHAPRVMVNFGTKLRNIIGMAAGWDKTSPLQNLYDEMVNAAADETHLMAEPAAAAREALDALHKSSAKFDLASIADIPFPADVQAWGYRKWDAQKVIAACLNMGTAKNRQRLIDGYEWGDKGDSYCARIASLLSKEDWDNIQKLWNALGRSSLTERVRQTFKEEKHFDLKMEEAVPFGVRTSDGADLTVEGGYYPLDYLFHKNSFVQAEADASAYQNPAFRRASFTFERAEKLSDPLSLDLNLIHTHIFDTAHYVSHRQIMAKVLRVINDYHFKSHFQQTQGFERYQALKELCTNIAAPGAFLKGMTSGLENWGRTALTASALWFNPSVVAMQLSSLTFGIDELGAAYPEAVAQFLLHPKATQEFVLTRSGLMRDRVNLKDIDLRTPLNQFTETAPEHFRRLIMEFGYAPMRFVDLAVAVPAWMAAYNKAIDSGMDEIKAVAQADEFVAATQGATRAIDLSPLQLKAWGRSLTVFFSAVSAGATMGTKTLNRILSGSLTKYEAAFAAAANLLAPWLLSGAIRMLSAGPGGDDDPERPWRALIRELISNPFQGVPVLRDVADFVAGGIARKATGKKFFGTQRTVIENTAFRAISDLIVTAVEGIDAAVDENPERALYKLADAAGVLFRVPVIGVYERARRTLGSWTGDPDLFPDFDKQTRRRKTKTQW